MSLAVFPCPRCGCSDHTSVTYCKRCGMYFGGSIREVGRGLGEFSFTRPGVSEAVYLALVLGILMLFFIVMLNPSLYREGFIRQWVAPSPLAQSGGP